MYETCFWVIDVWNLQYSQIGRLFNKKNIILNTYFIDDTVEPLYNTVHYRRY